MRDLISGEAELDDEEDDESFDEETGEDRGKQRSTHIDDSSEEEEDDDDEEEARKVRILSLFHHPPLLTFIYRSEKVSLSTRTKMRRTRVKIPMSTDPSRGSVSTVIARKRPDSMMKIWNSSASSLGSGQSLRYR